MHGEAWTIERIALLKELWAGGSTAAAIADRLGGISRSAVLGKISRLRLKPAAAPRGKSKASDRAKVQAAAAGDASALRLFRSPARRRRRAQNEAQPQVVVAAKKRGRTLLELTNESCRWPFGDPGTRKFHFCGIAEADLLGGRPYCAHHMRRAAYASEAGLSGANHAACRHAPIQMVSVRTGQWKVRI